MRISWWNICRVRCISHVHRSVIASRWTLSHIYEIHLRKIQFVSYSIQRVTRSGLIVPYLVESDAVIGHSSSDNLHSKQLIHLGPAERQACLTARRENAWQSDRWPRQLTSSHLQKRSELFANNSLYCRCLYSKTDPKSIQLNSDSFVWCRLHNYRFQCAQRNLLERLWRT